MVKRMEDTIAGAQSRCEVSHDAKEADLIVYLDPFGFKKRAEAVILARQECIKRYPEKCFVWNYDIYPVAFLPGLYVSMPREHLDSSRVRPWCYPAPPNDEVTRMEPFIRDTVPEFLFTFRGVDTAKVRRRIIDLFGSNR